MGSIPCLISNALHLEKALHPKNPLSADKGEGCEASSKCALDLSITFPFICAYFPHNR